MDTDTQRNVNVYGSEAPFRLLVSGSRSLDERELKSDATIQARRACREAQSKFVKRLEAAVVELAVSQGQMRPVIVVHGDAKRGADSWADRWVYWAWNSGTFKREWLHVDRCEAKWRRPDGTVDKRAGRKRNGQMVDTMNRDLPHLVLVCWDGTSGGTKNLLDRATLAGLTIERTWM